MMLSVLRLQEAGEVDVEFDVYVPFTIRVGDVSPAPLYWRALDGAGGLFEVGIDRRSGVLQTATLTGVDACSVFPAGQVAPSPVEQRPGVPVCDLAGWKPGGKYQDDFVDHECPIRLLIGLTTVRLVLGNEPAVGSYFCRAGRVLFGVGDDNTLHTLLISDVRGDEMEMLRTNVSLRRPG